MDELRDRVERFVREHELIPAGGEVTCLVSGGAESTYHRHLLGSLGYRVSALHVNHKLRGADSEEDASFCADVLGADVVELDGRGASEAALREQTEGYCRAAGLEFRVDASNADTKRGLIRDEILPLLRRLHPAADENLLRALDSRDTLPPALAELLAAPVGSKRVDLGGGLQAVREHERLWLERGPVELAGEIRWGDWTIRSQLEGLRVRGWRPGDRLAGRRRKIQDVFVDAKVPRSEREAWPLVVRGDEVVAVPGIVEHPEVHAVRN